MTSCAGACVSSTRRGRALTPARCRRRWPTARRAQPLDWLAAIGPDAQLAAGSAGPQLRAPLPRSWATMTPQGAAAPARSRASEAGRRAAGQRVCVARGSGCRCRQSQRLKGLAKQQSWRLCVCVCAGVQRTAARGVCSSVHRGVCVHVRARVRVRACVCVCVCGCARWLCAMPPAFHVAVCHALLSGSTDADAIACMLRKRA
jgi:hypothetical protein